MVIKTKHIPNNDDKYGEFREAFRNTTEDDFSYTAYSMWDET